jgi:hypothetical protein
VPLDPFYKEAAGAPEKSGDYEHNVGEGTLGRSCRHRTLNIGSEPEQRKSKFVFFKGNGKFASDSSPSSAY